MDNNIIGFKQEYENKLTKYNVENNNKFLFSIIIPVYNVEKYLEETIQSVINQTLDFKKHVQIILVNDGSPDDSEKICLKFAREYPSNILYVKKENGGVSSARNKGLEYATGEYINFLDSDDILENDVLEKVYEFFSKNRNLIDVVCLPIYYFEAREGAHMLNDKFKKTQIIDTRISPEQIQLHVSSAFITREQAIKHKFDVNLKYGEDAKYINEIILEKGKYGVLSNTKYYYRIRNNQSSAIQTSRISASWYNESLIYFSKELINYAIKKWGEVPKYLQYIIMYDLQWKFKVNEIPTNILDEEKQAEFIKLVIDVLQYIDDDVINYQKYINFHQKNFVLKLKYLNHEKNLVSYLYLKDNIKLFLNGSMINSLKDQQVYLNLIEIKGDKIFIEGMFASGFDASDCEISILFDGSEIKTERVNRPLNDIKVWGITVKKVYGFKSVLDASKIEKVANIEFVVNINQIKTKLKYKLSPKVRFSKKIPSFYAKDKLIIFPGKKQLKVIPNTFYNNLKKEAGMIKRLFRIRKEKTAAKKAIIVRAIYFLLKFFKNNKIYLFMDRIDKADDNAEVLFRYAVKKNDKIKKYFVISKDSLDYKRMKKYGKVVPYGSYKHKLLLLLSDKLISSHADEVIINPFRSTEIFYRDLITYDFVFLEHGVTQNDLSGWLNKYQKNIKLFITSSKKEYDSILNGSYGYTEKEVVCTGMPRHDRLVNENKKLILIMPTWRKNIASKLDRNFKRVYNDDFVKTKYFKMYNDLISNKEIINKLEEVGYKIKFVIHPALKEQTIDFTANDRVEILNPDKIRYYKLFNEASLLITDYSSVAFDFAYLRKPVIYFQFDQEEFHRDHFSSGYFNYEEMGFGPVIKTLNHMVDELKSALDNDCKLSNKYKERIDNFFVYSDRNNSQRVYDAINKI